MKKLLLVPLIILSLPFSLLFSAPASADDGHVTAPTINYTYTCNADGTANYTIPVTNDINDGEEVVVSIQYQNAGTNTYSYLASNYVMRDSNNANPEASKTWTWDNHEGTMLMSAYVSNHSTETRVFINHTEDCEVPTASWLVETQLDCSSQEIAQFTNTGNRDMTVDISLDGTVVLSQTVVPQTLEEIYLSNYLTEDADLTLIYTITAPDGTGTATETATLFDGTRDCLAPPEDPPPVVPVPEPTPTPDPTPEPDEDEDTEELAITGSSGTLWTLAIIAVFTFIIGLWLRTEGRAKLS